MRTIYFFITMLCLVCLSSAGRAYAADTDRGDIIEALSKYTVSINTQDADMTERLLHGEARHFVVIADTLRAIPTAAYTGMLRAKRIGGQLRVLTILSLEITAGSMAFAKIELVNPNPRSTFQQHISLMKHEDGWKIMNIMTVAS